MSSKILVVNGHPDPEPGRFCAALCDAYEAGARMRGFTTRRLDVGNLQLDALGQSNDATPLVRLEQAFRLMRAADRLAIFYPLWTDGPPAELKRLFDYTARLRAQLEPSALDGGKSARIVVTTTMPAFLYRGRRDSKAAPAQALTGIRSGEPLFIGSVDTISPAQRTRWLEQMRDLGEKAN